MQRANDFLDLQTDFGFKRLLSVDAALLGFLNAVLPVRVVDIRQRCRVTVTDESLYHAQTSISSNPSSDILDTVTTGKRKCVWQELRQESSAGLCDNSIRYDLICATDKHDIVIVK